MTDEKKDKNKTEEGGGREQETSYDNLNSSKKRINVGVYSNVCPNAINMMP